MIEGGRAAERPMGRDRGNTKQGRDREEETGREMNKGDIGEHCPKKRAEFQDMYTSECRSPLVIWRENLRAKFF